jgi:hypothetical protein
MQRTAYIPITRQDSLEREFKKDVLILDQLPPQVPFIKVKITLVKHESLYEFERPKKGRGRKTAT